jgi:uncharacterized protein (DUF1015 family)
MPAIKAFAAVRYDFSKVPPNRVVAPPYDVIDEPLRAKLYAADPHNVVRLIYGRGTDPYADAARLTSEWARSGVLRRDPEPAIYLLEQEFRLADGRSFVRSGFIAACRLEEFGGSVLPHEKTHSGPKEDRLRLMNATGMMFSQIFSIYSDPGHAVDRLAAGAKSGPPDCVAAFDGVVNRMWVCRDHAVSLGVSGFLQDARVLVADGHHRYETALAYRDAMRMKNPLHGGHEPYNFVPMFFSNMHDAGMLVLATHRIVRGIPGLVEAHLLQGLGRYFTMSEYPSLEAMNDRLSASGVPAVGMALKSRKCFHLLELKPEGSRLLEGVPDVVRRLDVAVLHGIILERILGISAESQDKRTNLEYERDELETLRILSEGDRQAAFFMRPTPLDDVRLVAEAGRTLPQKSTYFFPKLLSGLANYVFDGEDRW